MLLPRLRSSFIALLIAANLDLGLPLFLRAQVPSAPDPLRGAVTVTDFPTAHVFEQWQIGEANLFKHAHVSATLTQVSFIAGDGPERPLQPPWAQHWKVDQVDDDFLVRIAGKDGSFDHATGRNPKYAFDIRRKGEKEGWRITQFENNAYVGTLATNTSNRVLNFLRAPYYVWNYPVQMLFGSDRLNGVTATRIGAGPKEVVTVEFQYDGNPSSEENIDYITGGVVRFEPARHWAIRDFELRIRPAPKTAKRGPTTRVMQTCTYGPPELTEPTGVQLDVEMTSKQGLRVNRWVVTIDDVKPSNLGKDGYTLRAFGLEEPPLPGSTSPFIGRWFWFLQGGIFVLLIGLLFRRRIVKRSIS